MTVDEAIEVARRYNNDERVTWDEFIPAFEQLAAEVIRLGAELAELRQKRCNENSEIELQALRVLDPSEVDSDSVPPTGPELVEMMADVAVLAMEERNLWHSTALRLRDELAAYKQAHEFSVHQDLKLAQQLMRGNHDQ